MFEQISFTHIETERPLTSLQVSPQTLQTGKYDAENLVNSQFYITGSVDVFARPPITAFAQENLFHLQSFDIFHYGKDSYTRRQNYHSFQILYTYRGKGYLEYENRAYALAPQTGVFLDCRLPHYYRAEEDWSVAVLHFRGPLAEFFCQAYGNSGQVLFQEPETGRFHRYLEQLLGIYDSPSLHRDIKASHCIEGMLLYLLGRSGTALTGEQESPVSVRTAMKYMENNFSKPITLDKLEALTNTNKYHLSKEFKRYTGFSPYDYLICLRIEQAKLLLKTTDLPASKIAHRVGIHDINNFNYLFKKKVGMTPIQYRNQTAVAV